MQYEKIDSEMKLVHFKIRLKDKEKIELLLFFTFSSQSEIFTLSLFSFTVKDVNSKIDWKAM